MHPESPGKARVFYHFSVRKQQEHDFPPQSRNVHAGSIWVSETKYPGNHLAVTLVLTFSG